MPNQIIQLRDPKDSTRLFNPVTSANAVLCDKGGGQIGTLQSIISAIMQAQGGGGGGDTVTGKTVTLSTTGQAVIQVNGIDSGTVALPSNIPSTWLGDNSSNAAAGNHNHGDLSNNGSISTDTTAASGQHLVVTDANGYIKRSDLTFGSSTSTYLRNDGTWGTPAGQGGGDTVTGKTVTLSTTGQAVIQVNGTDSGTVALPSDIPTTWLGTAATNASAGNHAHGDITYAGKIQTSSVNIATSDSLVIVAGSNSRIHKTSITFDTSNTTDFLRKDGTWATPAGGGGTTVTLPSGYSANTGITLSSSTLTTIATVGGVDLKLKAPAGSGGGSTVAYTSQDSNRAGETPISHTTLVNTKGTYVGDLTIDNVGNTIIVPPAHLNHSVEEENFTGLGTVKPMLVSEILDRESEPAFIDDEVFNPQGYVLKMPISGPGSDTEWALIPIICDVHYNADTNRYESVPYIALPSALLNDYIDKYWDKDGTIPVEPQEPKE